jgi:hypothetical protein
MSDAPETATVLPYPLASRRVYLREIYFIA